MLSHNDDFALVEEILNSDDAELRMLDVFFFDDLWYYKPVSVVQPDLITVNRKFVQRPYHARSGPSTYNLHQQIGVSDGYKSSVRRTPNESIKKLFEPLGSRIYQSKLYELSAFAHIFNSLQLKIFVIRDRKRAIKAMSEECQRYLIETTQIFILKITLYTGGIAGARKRF